MRDGDIRLAKFKGHMEDRDKKVREIGFLEKCSVCSRASVRKRCSRADHVVVHAWLSLCASAIGSVPVQSGSTQPRVPISSWTLTCGVDTQRNMKRASNYVRGVLERVQNKWMWLMFVH